MRSRGGIAKRAARADRCETGRAGATSTHTDGGEEVERAGSETTERGAVRGAHDALLTGRYAEARRKLRAVLEARPRDRAVLAAYHLAAGYEARWAGRHREARRHFEAVLRLEKRG
jgi:tetratricopeptide (TPR) repeat protein